MSFLRRCIRRADRRRNVDWADEANDGEERRRGSAAGMNNEEIVQRALEGDLATAKWAIPRVVKIFVSATRPGTYYKSVSTILSTRTTCPVRLLEFAIE